MKEEDRVTQEEREAAERLREALEGRAAGADPESLAAARLLASLGEASATDELAARRLRNELAARARRKGLLRRYRLPAAAAALLLAAGLFALRREAPSPDLLAARERAAREALARLDAPLSPLSSVTERRQEALAETYRAARYEALLKARTEELLGTTSPAAAPGLSPSPTPGGAS